MVGALRDLASQWDDRLQSFSPDPQLSRQTFLELVTAYSSKHRVYHTLEHLQQVLAITEQMRDLSSNFPALQLAAWFHDIIYDPTAKDNEIQSAEVAVNSLRRLNIPQATLNHVKSLILSTQNHQPFANDLDHQILLDADLSILGEESAQYQAYAQAIRQEYAWVPEAEYREARQQVLQKFLQRARLYFTDWMFTTREEKARQNIKAELATYQLS